MTNDETPLESLKAARRRGDRQIRREDFDAFIEWVRNRLITLQTDLRTSHGDGAAKLIQPAIEQFSN